MQPEPVFNPGIDAYIKMQEHIYTYMLIVYGIYIHTYNRSGVS